MPLKAGTRLGPYEILSPQGAGGMGEVYRAKDTRLDRTVAIKVLPQHLSTNPDLKQRFEREARTISSLSHPNICALHDIGHQDGIDFLVMEFLEGETLAERLLKGALTTEVLLRYGIQITDALDRAHKQGIVHRDLKPGNIMLTKSGVKLLDFGLAKLQASTLPSVLSGTSRLPTEQRDLTAEGTILGTVQYMAPEQLEGRESDARTDIFALGVVLYEMATGKHAFTGKSHASLIAAILKEKPTPISQHQPLAPPALERVVQTCMAKDPEERWQTAHDVMLELKWIAEGGSQAGVAAPVTIRRRNRERILGGVVGLIAGALIGGLTVLAFFRTSTSLVAPVTRFTLTLPQTERLSGSTIALSPDGESLVYSVRIGSRRQLYVRSMDRLKAVPIAGTEEGLNPFFSPDGQWIAFVVDGKLKKVSFGGGTPLNLCDVQDLIGASWAPDQIFHVKNWLSGLSTVGVMGRDQRTVAEPDLKQKERGFIWPDVLPGGRAVLMTVFTGGSFPEESRIVVQPLPAGQRRTVIEGGTCARYVPTGHIVYARAGSLFAVPFNVSKLEVTGTPVAVVDGVAINIGNGSAIYSFSKNGSLAYVPGGMLVNERSLVWVDRKGQSKTLSDAQHPFFDPHISPDGRQIAVMIEGATFDVWAHDIARDTLSRVSFIGDEQTPRWTPDGKRIIFASSPSGKFNIFWKAPDGSGSEERLTQSDHSQFPSSCSPDGRLLAYTDRDDVTGNVDVWILPLQGDRRPVPFLRTSFHEEDPVFSPDGRMLAYVSDESGRPEVYVQAFPAASGGKWKISNDGGSIPRWAPDGKEIFYRNGDKLMAVTIQTKPAFNAARPVLLFERNDLGASYDVAFDGQRLLMVQENEEQTAIRQMNVVLGWFEDLKRRVPSERR